MINVCFYIGHCEVKHINHAIFNATKVHIDLFKSQSESFIIATPSKFYYDLLIKSYPKEKVFLVNKKSLKNVISKYEPKNLWSPDIITTLYLKAIFLFKKNNIVTWFQGTAPEESYLRNNSKFRLYILNFLEYFSVKYSKKHIYVSEFMQQHYLKKYKITPADSIIVPCFSDLNYQKQNKIKNSFCYIGGLSKWQCFDKIVELYVKNFSHLQDSKLYVVTRDIQNAKLVLEKFNCVNYSLSTLNDRSEISDFLSKMEYGFLIRDNILLNNVASPIKFAEYLSCGVKVIMNKSVPHFSKIIEENNIGCIINESDEIELFNESIITEEIISTYDNFFNYQKISLNYQKFLS